MNAHQIVEAVLFASDAPLTADEIARADERLDEDEVEQALQFLRAEYDDAERSFQLTEVAEGYQILTRPEFAPYLERFDNVPKPSKLSGPALETLAIIAYRQPIGRVEVEYIRGVGCSGVIRTLQDRLLVEVVGREEGLGRPLLYGTTQHFLEHFGFKSLEDLPRPEDLPVVLRDRVPLDPDEEGEPVDPDQTDLALGNGDGEAAAEEEAVDEAEMEEAAAEGDEVEEGGDGDASGPDGEPEEEETPEERARRAAQAVKEATTPEEDEEEDAVDAEAPEETDAEEEDAGGKDAEEEDVEEEEDEDEEEAGADGDHPDEAR